MVPFEPPYPPGFTPPPITWYEIAVDVLVLAAIVLPLWIAAHRQTTRYKRVRWD